MRLRNKKTGEILGSLGSFIIQNPNHINCEAITKYDSLAELNEDWEDVPTEEVWYLGERIGNYSMPKEEAEKAAEKLKAWKRLKDKGFRFKGYTDDSGDLFSCQFIRCRFDDFGKESRKDLDLLFGGEK